MNSLASPSPWDPDELAGWLDPASLENLEQLSRTALEPDRHGRLPEWQAALERLPETRPGWRVEAGCLKAGSLVARPAELAETLGALIPWRKGPLNLGGVDIETEWRSDWKWDRMSGVLDLAGCNVLDVGAGNGYFGWRMLEAGAQRVVGCDPTLVFVMQHRAIQHFARDPRNHLLPLGIQDLPETLDRFDVVFSMGVLYHRRDSHAHLADLHARLAPGGALMLETLILPGHQGRVLEPPGRYARMRNVHALPDEPVLMEWLRAAGFRQSRVLDVTVTSFREQKTTPWMPFHSLDRALEPEAPDRTVEGHPAPTRAVVLARRDG